MIPDKEYDKMMDSIDISKIPLPEELTDTQKEISKRESQVAFDNMLKYFGLR